MSQTITAMYDKASAAETAVRKLVAAGIPRASIKMVAGAADTTTRTGTSYDHTRDEGGFWSSLKDLFIPEEDRYAYSEGLSRGGTMLTVTADDDHSDKAMDILEEEGSIDFEERETAWRSEGWTGYPAPSATTSASSVGTTAAVGTTAVGAMSTGEVSTGTSSTGTTGVQTRSPTAGQPVDEVIPIIQEKLSVGKRVADHGRVRIRSYVVETPVQEQVALSSERVQIDRHAVDRPVTAADEALFAEKTIEATEHEEVAVVSKDARVVEEVGLRKDTTQRTETVSDKVRRTEVEVDDQRAATKVPAGLK